MDLKLQLGRVRDWLLHFGAYPEETLEQRAKRRLFLAVGWIASVLTIPNVVEALGSGFYWVAGIYAFVVALFIALLVALQWKPRLFSLWVQLTLGIILLANVPLAALQGGLVASGSAGPDKLPGPYLPEGARLTANEGAGDAPAAGGDVQKDGAGEAEAKEAKAAPPP